MVRHQDRARCRLGHQHHYRSGAIAGIGIDERATEVRHGRDVAIIVDRHLIGVAGAPGDGDRCTVRASGSGNKAGRLPASRHEDCRGSYLDLSGQLGALRLGGRCWV